jgi:uncharacterized protein YceK
MKKLLVVFMFSLVLLGCASVRSDIEPVTGEVASEIVEAEGTSKDDLYVRANSWAVDTFVSAESVIEFQDKDAGIIKGKYLFNVVGGMYFHDVKTTITVETRDGKARISLSDPMVRITGSMMGSSTPTKYKPIDSQAVLDLSQPEWEALIADFRQAMQKQKADW